VSAALSVLLLLLSDDVPVTGNERLPSEIAGTWDVVRAYSLCPSPRRGNYRFPTEPWVALLGSEQLALHYDNQVLLLFQRRPAGTTPTASFDCAKAASRTEKTICASFDLASWDRSVSQAWRAALDRRPDKQAHLRKTQKEWLHARDVCGNKADCIDDLQWRRVDELTQE
jgi:uncharacterized protein YecT (DUF1311 family)